VIWLVGRQVWDLKECSCKGALSTCKQPVGCETLGAVNLLGWWLLARCETNSWSAAVAGLHWACMRPEQHSVGVRLVYLTAINHHHQQLPCYSIHQCCRPLLSSTSPHECPATLSERLRAATFLRQQQVIELVCHNISSAAAAAGCQGHRPAGTATTTSVGPVPAAAHSHLQYHD